MQTEIIKIEVDEIISKKLKVGESTSTPTIHKIFKDTTGTTGYAK